MRIATIIANFSKAPAMCGSKIARRHGAYDRRGELGESIGLAATTQTAELLEALGTDRDGLDAKRADELRAEVGGNVPTRARRAPAALRLAKSMASPFSLILAVLAAISLYTNVIVAAPDDKDPSTCIIIAVMVLISGILGFVQEDRGIAAAESLRTLVTTTCRLKRAGEPAREVPFAELVPGDIVLLAAGDLIPADARVIEAKDLFVNQTALTGESEPVEKNALPCDADAGALTVGDCTSIVFTGTTVVSGSARAVVVATGDATYVGRVMRTVRERPARTSFDAGVASVSRVLVGFMLVMCPIVFVINGVTKGDWLDALLFTASVAVGITPQMLPVIVTTCLARGAREMARREVIVKDLSAIQNLGAMDVLCCDKTGTLTEDRVVLERHLNADGEKDDRVLRHAFLVSHFQTGLRNLIDEAIEERGLALARSGSPELAGAIERWRKVDEVPFDFERRRMSVVVEDAAGKTQMVTKGAVEEVLAACSHVELDGRALPLDEGRRARVLADAARMNDEGLRVIAVAQRTDPRPVGAFSAADERDLVLIGYLAFLDPPKASAAEAVERLTAAGVSVRVLTGDAEGVAAAVCRKVGIRVDGMLTGREVEAMDDAELAERAEGVQLFARLSPLQKARVVDALRGRGHVVGFMGDGINDAAALRAADAGISVDTAVDVAKETAQVILTRKDLVVLGRAVREGRRTYGNTIKYVKATASSNFGNMLSVLVASAFLPFLPMTALQLLLLGLVYTLSCAAIPWDRVDESFLARPRTWDARSIVSFMLWMGPASSVFDIATFAALFFLVGPIVTGAPWGELAQAGDAAGMALFIAVFHTGWFLESLWTQTLVLHVLRTEQVPFVQSRPAPALLAVTLAGTLAACALPYAGALAGALGLVAPPAEVYPLIASCVAGYVMLVSIMKGAYVRRRGSLL